MKKILIVALGMCFVTMVSASEKCEPISKLLRASIVSAQSDLLHLRDLALENNNKKAICLWSGYAQGRLSQLSDILLEAQASRCCGVISDSTANKIDDLSAEFGKQCFDGGMDKVVKNAEAIFELLKWVPSHY